MRLETATARWKSQLFRRAAIPKVPYSDVPVPNPKPTNPTNLLIAALQNSRTVTLNAECGEHPECRTGLGLSLFGIPRAFASPLSEFQYLALEL